MKRFNQTLTIILEEEVITLPISSLLMTKSELFAAVSNITRGYPAQTEGPVEIAYLEAAQKYELVNGYHRMVEFLTRGIDQVKAQVQDVDTSNWMVPTADDTFVYQPDMQYGGLEDFIEPYMIRRL